MSRGPRAPCQLVVSVAVVTWARRLQAAAWALAAGRQRHSAQPQSHPDAWLDVEAAVVPVMLYAHRMCMGGLMRRSRRP